MASLPKTMKAWVFPRAGKARDALAFKSKWQMPAAPKAGEIMMKVSYASINRADHDLMGTRIPFRRNAIPAMDFVGNVIQAGPLASTSATSTSSSSSSSSSQSGIRTGMTVAGTVPLMSVLRGAGSLAEYLVVPASAVAEKPSGMDETVAAGLMGVAGQTSATLLRNAKLSKGDRVLVNGASGGVGSVLVQVLNSMGVHVTGVCSGKNADLVRTLGAEEVIDYTAAASTPVALLTLSSSPNFTSFDVIIDCVGNEELYRHSPAYLNPAGRFLTIAGNLLLSFKYPYLPVFLGGIPRSYTHVVSQGGGAAAREVANWFEKGLVKNTPIDSIFDMENAVQAFERSASARAVGKVLVKI
ncbi:hypothetical protein BX600DRAFT_499479 [Xylariales sp. PMI_506]|nr:hypothetical protein BX600DRAFT_499479 [Xylariales sp. PMI_506]